jgi:hypothetical protein
MPCRCLHAENPGPEAFFGTDKILGLKGFDREPCGSLASRSAQGSVTMGKTTTAKNHGVSQSIIDQINTPVEELALAA